MKKLTSTLGIFALAIGAAAAMAMSPAPKKVGVTSKSTNYHYFRLGTGEYLGEDSDTDKQSECGIPENPCVLQAEGVDQNENPTGTQVTINGQVQL